MQRVTKNLLWVGAALLAQPNSVHWGYELSRSTGVKAGAMYPILARMLAADWVEDGWEDSPASGRPPRRYYRLTDLGRASLAELLATHPSQPHRHRRPEFMPNHGAAK